MSKGTEDKSGLLKATGNVDLSRNYDVILNENLLVLCLIKSAQDECCDISAEVIEAVEKKLGGRR